MEETTNTGKLGSLVRLSAALTPTPWTFRTWRGIRGDVPGSKTKARSFRAQ